MLEAFAKITKKLLGLDQEVETPLDAKAEFHLLYDGITVGILAVENGVWTFRYTDEFRQHPELRPIVEFPDLNKVYRSDALWPFFQMRIPSRTQESVEDIIKREHIQENDEVRLLKRFGRRTIANPYELVAA
jgi:HipA-like protein